MFCPLEQKIEHIYKMYVIKYRSSEFPKRQHICILISVWETESVRRINNGDVEDQDTVKESEESNEM